MAYEKKPLENWQKFTLTDGSVLSNLRYMLDVGPGEEFSEELWKVMALHKCLESNFVNSEWSPAILCSMVIESGWVRNYQSNIKFLPGEKVFVTKVQREGIYWFCGPMNRHMVNCQGDIFLVRASEIEAPEAAISDSALNRHARLGEKIDAAVPEHLKPKVPEPVA